MLTIEQIKTLINGLKQPVLNMAGRLIVAEETARQALDRSKQALSNMSAKMDKVNPVGEGSFSLGRNPSSSIGVASFAVGASVEASGNTSHAEGSYTVASGAVSHAEGASSTASGYATHAEGNFTQASGDYSHAEGNFTQAPGMFAHAEGFSTQAQGMASHAEGRYTRAEHGCHAEGAFTEAVGQYCHAEGYSNIPLEGFLHIVGNGSDEGNRRSNAHTLDWEGNAWFQGDVLVGSTSGTNKDDGSVRLAKITEVIPAPVKAEVGQTVRVSAVSESGAPTAWEAADQGLELIADVTVTEEDFTLLQYEFTRNANGEPFEYSQLIVNINATVHESLASGSAPNLYIDGVDGKSYVYYFSRAVVGGPGTAYSGTVRMAMIGGNVICTHIGGQGDVTFVAIRSYGGGDASAKYNAVRMWTFAGTLDGDRKWRASPFAPGSRIKFYGVR